jgi:subtilisin family serine protease
MFSLAAALALVPAAPALYAEVSPIVAEGMLCHPRNLMVRILDEMALTDIEATGSRVLRRIPEIGWVVVEAPAGRLLATKRLLSRSGGVAACTLDRASRPAYTPNDPKWPDQWHMRQIKADLAWDTTFGGSAPIIAVLDTGVRVDHEDLARNIWKNKLEIPGNGIDDDLNGFVDDYNGYDFAYDDGNPDDVHGHGTGCSGLAAGVGDNGIGIIGVAPKARIMAVKVARNDGYFFDSSTVPGYIYATNMGARTFSMSFYSDRVSQSEEDALRYAYGKGVVPVAAAGNDASVFPYYPAGYDFVLSVAATDGSNNKASFSNWGWWVDVAAPGVGLTTTSANGGYMGFSGTSGAAPHVAGLVALLKSAHPSSNKVALRNTIEDTATLLSQSPFGEFSSNGLVNAQAAMAAIISETPPAQHAPKVNFISPVGYVASGTGGLARVFGRNLQGAKVKIGGTPAIMSSTSRDSAYFRIGVKTGPITVETATGEFIASFTPPENKKPVWPLNEASAPGSSVFGGFAEALSPDGEVLRCTRRSDGQMILQMSFRRLPTTGAFKLVIKRNYTNGTAGTEKVQLYNYASASYPYGPFDDLSAVSLPAGSKDLLISIPSITPYVDFEGTMYLRMLVTGLPSGAELNLDTAYFRK